MCELLDPFIGGATFCFVIPAYLSSRLSSRLSSLDGDDGDDGDERESPFKRFDVNYNNN